LERDTSSGHWTDHRGLVMTYQLPLFHSREFLFKIWRDNQIVANLIWSSKWVPLVHPITAQIMDEMTWQCYIGWADYFRY
jgi:hypothetical protein